MNWKSWALLALVILSVGIAGCQPLPAPATQPIAAPVLSDPSAGSTVAVAASTTPVAAVAAVSTATPVPPEEEDCDAPCHQPGGDYFSPAMNQPADHVERTTCLNCHASANQPPLPASHLGRLDHSCTVCHLEQGKSK